MSGRVSGFPGCDDIESGESGVLYSGPRVGLVWGCSHGWTGLCREGPERARAVLMTLMCPGYGLSA